MDAVLCQKYTLLVCIESHIEAKTGKINSQANKPAENKGTCWLLLFSTVLTKNDFSWYMFTYLQPDCQWCVLIFLERALHTDNLGVTNESLLMVKSMLQLHFGQL